MRHETPPGHNEKLVGFISACEKAKGEKVPNVNIARPQALGDTYEEVIESPWRLADARLSLLIAGE